MISEVNNVDMRLVSAEVKMIIENLRDSNGNPITSYELAKITGIAAYMFRSYREGRRDIERKGTAIKIIKGIFSGKELKDLCETYAGTELGKLLLAEHNKELNEQIVNLPENVSKYFEDPHTAVLMALAQGSDGVDPGVIKEEFGGTGIKLLKDLIDQKMLLANEEGKIITPMAGKVIQFSKVCKIKHTVRLMERSILNANLGHTVLETRVKTVNKRTFLPVLRNIIREAEERINEEIVFHRGKDPIFYSFIGDALLRDTEEEGPRLKKEKVMSL